MMENVPSAAIRSTIPVIPYVSECTIISFWAAGFQLYLAQDAMQVSRKDRMSGFIPALTTSTSFQIPSASSEVPR
jgi:hypothetical protein